MENGEFIRKLRWNEPLTASDLTELEHLPVEAGTGTRGNIDRAKSENNGLGLFVRSLVGLNRQAAERALDQFLDGKNLSAQIDFVNVVIEHLSLRGWIDRALLYELPFTDFSPSGVEGVFQATRGSSSSRRIERLKNWWS